MRLLDLPWLAVELREWFASTRSTARPRAGGPKSVRVLRVLCSNLTDASTGQEQGAPSWMVMMMGLAMDRPTHGFPLLSCSWDYTARPRAGGPRSKKGPKESQRKKLGWRAKSRGPQIQEGAQSDTAAVILKYEEAAAGGPRSKKGPKESQASHCAPSISSSSFMLWDWWQWTRLDRAKLITNTINFANPYITTAHNSFAWHSLF